MLIETNGIQSRYELSGAEGAEVILCSHSLATDLNMWWPQLDALGEKYRLLRYDTRGHGGSDAPPGPYSLEQLADDALALLDGLGIERAHWLGISMGGMIGQTFALRHPQRLASLSTCDSMAQFPAAAAGAWQERLQAAKEQGMEGLVAPTLERWFSPGFAAAQPATIDRVASMIRATPVTGYLGCSQAIMQLDLLGKLADINQPVLVLVGEEDPGTPVAASEAIHQRISGSRLVVIPTARHLTNIETAADFNRAVLDFLPG